MSDTARLEPHPTPDQPAVFCCQGWAVNSSLQPPPPAPLPFHTDSPVHAPPAPSVPRRVPPTATTWGEEAGNSVNSPSGGSVSQFRYPLSPAEAVMTVPGRLKGLAASSVGVSPSSGPPHEFDISVAPR